MEVFSESIKASSIEFCDRLISHIHNGNDRRRWKSLRNLALSENKQWNTFIITVDNVSVSFYHNSNAKIMKYAIKIAPKYATVSNYENIIQKDLMSKDNWIDEDYEVMAMIVVSIVNIINQYVNLNSYKKENYYG